MAARRQTSSNLSVNADTGLRENANIQGVTALISVETHR